MSVSESPRICLAKKGCDYRNMQLDRSLQTLVKLEATVETEQDKEQKQDMAHQLADVTYELYTEEELNRASKCAECVLTVCKDFRFNRHTSAKPSEIVEIN